MYTQYVYRRRVATSWHDRDTRVRDRSVLVEMCCGGRTRGGGDGMSVEMM